MQDGPSDIDDLIFEEQKSFARESVGEAWAHARSEGVEQMAFADAAICTALEGVVREFGEQAADELLAAMKERLTAGIFEQDVRYH
jgi:hypothetical protein